jgi:sulfur transfer protein SufE
LIQYGDVWAADAKKKSSGEFDRFKKGEKVSGCMADVRITTTFSYPENPEDDQNIVPRISVDGTADSRVAQGILALICQVHNLATLS